MSEFVEDGLQGRGVGTKLDPMSPRVIQTIPPSHLGNMDHPWRADLKVLSQQVDDLCGLVNADYPEITFGPSPITLGVV